MKAILRFEVSINDTAQTVPHGQVVLFGRSERHQAPGLEDLVDVWVEMPDDDPEAAAANTRAVQVCGTGQSVPGDWAWLASFIDGHLVWHLYDLSLAVTR